MKLSSTFLLSFTLCLALSAADFSGQDPMKYTLIVRKDPGVTVGDNMALFQNAWYTDQCLPAFKDNCSVQVPTVEGFDQTSTKFYCMVNRGNPGYTFSFVGKTEEWAQVTTGASNLSENILDILCGTHIESQDAVWIGFYNEYDAAKEEEFRAAFFSNLALYYIENEDNPSFVVSVSGTTHTMKIFYTNFYQYSGIYIYPKLLFNGEEKGATRWTGGNSSTMCSSLDIDTDSDDMVDPNFGDSKNLSFQVTQDELEGAEFELTLTEYAGYDRGSVSVVAEIRKCKDNSVQAQYNGVWNIRIDKINGAVLGAEVTPIFEFIGYDSSLIQLDATFEFCADAECQAIYDATSRTLTMGEDYYAKVTMNTQTRTVDLVSFHMVDMNQNQLLSGAAQVATISKSLGSTIVQFRFTQTLNNVSLQVLVKGNLARLLAEAEEQEADEEYAVATSVSFGVAEVDDDDDNDGKEEEEEEKKNTSEGASAIAFCITSAIWSLFMY